MRARSLIMALTLMPALAFAQSGQVQTKQYDDGGIYEGTFRGGLQHGQGTYKLPNQYTSALLDLQRIHFRLPSTFRNACSSHVPCIFH